MSQMTTAELVRSLHGVRDHANRTHGEYDRTVVFAAQRLEALQAENERLTKALDRPHGTLCMWCGEVYEHIYTEAEAANPELLAAILAWAREHDRQCEHNPLRAENERLNAIVEKGLDYEHHSSCGHVWTMRATACPVCFEEMRAEVARLRESVANWERIWEQIKLEQKGGA